MQSPEYLFVYGTLKRGFENDFAQKLNRGAAYYGEGYFPGKLFKIDWYPGAIYLPESDLKVFGEIFRIENAALLRALDEYEEVLEDETESLYVRKQIEIKTFENQTLTCWTYLYNQSTENLEWLPAGVFIM